MENRSARTTRLYNRILEYEERLDRLRFQFPTNTRADDDSRSIWMEARHILRMTHEELLASDLEFLEEGQLLTALWMKSYYAVVEKGRELLGKGPNTSHSNEIGQANLDLLGILEEGLGFFTVLVHRLCKLSGHEIIMPVSVRGPSFGASPVVRPEIVKAVWYDCLLYLGDLARYRSLVLESLQSDHFGLTNEDSGRPGLVCHLRLAEGYYRQAAQLFSDVGHAYNQLAVLCCMSDDFLSGIRYYLRATLSKHAFPKAAGNLVTSCRRLVTIPEERLALSENPVHAATFGLLLRLCSAAIVHDLSRSSQSAHMDSIHASLVKLFTLPTDALLAGMNSEEEHVLTSLYVILLFTIEFLQRDSVNDDADSTGRHLNPTQLRLFQWLFMISEKLLAKASSSGWPGLKPLSIFSLWLSNSDILQRYTNTTLSQSSSESNKVNSFLRLLAHSYNSFLWSELDHNPLHCSLPEDANFLGSRILDIVPDETGQTSASEAKNIARTRRLKHLVMLLVERDGQLVLSEGRCHLRGDFEKAQKKAMMGTKLAKQRLVSEISSLQGPPNALKENKGSPAHWHIVDAEVLLQYWDTIEKLLIDKTQLRLIVLLATLRYLDIAKTDSNQMATARRIMRFIAAQTRKVPHIACIHLQHPIETRESKGLEAGDLGRLLASLPRHHKALLSAVSYYRDPALGYSPLMVVCSDVRVYPLVERLDVDVVCGDDHLIAYFASLSP